MSHSEAFVIECKEFINKGNLTGLQEFVLDYLDDAQIAWEYVIQKLYVHACLKKQKDIAEWISSQIERLDPIQQIAIRQMFPYGRWLLAR
jgi:hypothetical protein